MAKINANGLTVHYQQKGEGDDVILIHGVTSSLAVWYSTLLPSLSKEFRVTAYDLRGHGLTTMPDSGYDSRQMAEDLAGLMDAIGIKRARLVGHSYGGSIATHLALNHPDKVQACVLLDSGLACLRHMRPLDDWAGWDHYQKKADRYGLTLEWFKKNDQNQDISALLRKAFSMPTEWGFRKGTVGASRRVRKLLDQTRVAYEFREIGELTEDRLPEIAAPVLALYGASSPNLKMATHMSEIMPNCRCEALPDQGHFYLMDEPTLVLDGLLDFLRDPAGYLARPVESADPARIEQPV